MKTASPVLNPPCTAYAEALPLLRSRAADYLELTKPRIAVMVLFTVAVGAILAAGGMIWWWPLVHVLVGTALVAAGGSTLNQVIERHTDSLMRRTENRPLPAGRIRPIEAATMGLLLGVAGIVYLAATLPQPLAALLGGLTFVCYVFVYTPLKRRTTLNTLIGAIPGALPPVIGWAAIRGSIDREAVVLFSIIFLWQVPHFLAIAWIYREDYHRAGLRMLPDQPGGAAVAGRQMVVYSAALLATSLVPVGLHSAGLVYLVGASALGLMFLVYAFGFVWMPSIARARRVLRASLVYLPALLALLLVNAVLR
ncbi:MAG TPA: heme o synthase [Gemmataceae bacterium]|nr:heme o synthase [Gemmataceae bacterium]